MGLQVVLYLLATLLRAAKSRLSQCLMTMRSSSAGRPAKDIVGLTCSILNLLVRNSFSLLEMISIEIQIMVGGCATVLFTKTCRGRELRKALNKGRKVRKNKYEYNAPDSIYCNKCNMMRET